ncbi:MAG: hypothetical protein LBR50_10120 [Tannerella sp.]|jgi:hypothetical protein|nr:hypothetical protein [Tannerella sp.]
MATEENKRKIAMGKFFYDLAKLTFAALVLGGLMTFFQSADTTPLLWLILSSGIVLTALFAWLGDRFNK